MQLADFNRAETKQRRDESLASNLQNEKTNLRQTILSSISSENKFAIEVQVFSFEVLQFQKLSILRILIRWAACRPGLKTEVAPQKKFDPTVICCRNADEQWKMLDRVSNSDP
jgi:hypothetical protein